MDIFAWKKTIRFQDRRRIAHCLNDRKRELPLDTRRTSDKRVLGFYVLMFLQKGLIVGPIKTGKKYTHPEGLLTCIDE